MGCCRVLYPDLGPDDLWPQTFAPQLVHRFRFESKVSDTVADRNLHAMWKHLEDKVVEPYLRKNKLEGDIVTIGYRLAERPDMEWEFVTEAPKLLRRKLVRATAAAVTGTKITDFAVFRVLPCSSPEYSHPILRMRKIVRQLSYHGCYG